ncbi:MAG: phage tail tape measure protein [FCB group bacterium]|nr:phage tail tape measure protein [FCB group bacterium]
MPKKHDVDVSVGVTGAEKYKRDTEKVGKATDKMGDKVEKTGKKSAGAFEKLSAKFATWLAGYIGVTTLIQTAATAAQKELETLNKNLEISRKAYESFTGAIFLGQMSQETPGLVQKVGAIATKTGMGSEGLGKLAKVYYDIKSRTDLDAAGRLAHLEQVARFTQTDKGASPSSINDILISLMQQVPGATPTQASNFLNLAITEAGSSMAQMGTYVPRALPIGDIAKLSPVETAGLYARATRLMPGDPGIPTTALKAMMTRLAAPESGAINILKKYGITPDMPIMQQLGKLAPQAGQITASEYKELFDMRGMGLAPLLLKDWGGVQGAIKNIGGYQQGDILGDKIRKYYAPGTTASRMEAISQIEAQRTATKAIPDTKGQLYDILRKIQAETAERQGYGGAGQWMRTAGIGEYLEGERSLEIYFQRAMNQDVWTEKERQQYLEPFGLYQPPQPAGGATIINNGVNINFNDRDSKQDPGGDGNVPIP